MDHKMTKLLDYFQNLFSRNCNFDSNLNVTDKVYNSTIILISYNKKFFFSQVTNNIWRLNHTEIQLSRMLYTYRFDLEKL